MLAKNARTTLAFRQPALSLTSIASRLAPTGKRIPMWEPRVYERWYPLTHRNVTCLIKKHIRTIREPDTRPP
jgi:hypothetical protein